MNQNTEHNDITRVFLLLRDSVLQSGLPEAAAVRDRRVRDLRVFLIRPHQTDAPFLHCSYPWRQRQRL